MRPIDANALYRKVKTECNPYGKPTIGFEDGCKFMDMIDDAPTIEVDLMIRLIKEIEWYYQNRKSWILPIGYEDMLADAVHHAAQNMWENVSVRLDELQKVREETE